MAAVSATISLGRCVRRGDCFCGGPKPDCLVSPSVSGSGEGSFGEPTDYAPSASTKREESQLEGLTESRRDVSYFGSRDKQPHRLCEIGEKGCGESDASHEETHVRRYPVGSKLSGVSLQEENEAGGGLWGLWMLASFALAAAASLRERCGNERRMRRGETKRLQLFKLLGLPSSITPHPPYCSSCSPSPCHSPCLRLSSGFAGNGDTFSVEDNSLPLPWPLNCSGSRTLSRDLLLLPSSRGCISRTVPLHSEDSAFLPCTPRCRDVSTSLSSLQEISSNTFSRRLPDAAPSPQCCSCYQCGETSISYFPSLCSGKEGRGEKACGTLAAGQLHCGTREGKATREDPEPTNRVPTLMYEGWLLKESQWRRVWRPRYIMLFVVEQDSGCGAPCDISAPQRFSFTSDADNPVPTAATTVPVDTASTTRGEDDRAAFPGITSGKTPSAAEGSLYSSAECWDFQGPSQQPLPDEGSIFLQGHPRWTTSAIVSSDAWGNQRKTPTCTAETSVVPPPPRNSWNVPAPSQDRLLHASGDSELEGSATSDRQDIFRNAITSTTTSNVTWELLSETEEGQSEYQATGEGSEKCQEDGKDTCSSSRQVILAAFEKNPRCFGNRRRVEQSCSTLTCGSEPCRRLFSRHIFTSEREGCTYISCEQRRDERRKTALATLLGPEAPPPTEVFVLDCQQRVQVLPSVIPASRVQSGVASVSHSVIGESLSMCSAIQPGCPGFLSSAPSNPRVCVSPSFGPHSEAMSPPENGTRCHGVGKGQFPLFEDMGYSTEGRDARTSASFPDADPLIYPRAETDGRCAFHSRGQMPNHKQARTFAPGSPECFLCRLSGQQGQTSAQRRATNPLTQGTDALFSEILVLSGADGRRLRLAPCSLLRRRETSCPASPCIPRGGQRSSHTGFPSGSGFLHRMLNWWKTASRPEPVSDKAEPGQNFVSLKQETRRNRRTCSPLSQGPTCESGQYRSVSFDATGGVQCFSVEGTPDEAAAGCSLHSRSALSRCPSVEDNFHTGSPGGHVGASGPCESFLVRSPPVSLQCAQKLSSCTSSHACVGYPLNTSPASGAICSASTSTSPSLSFGWPSPLSDDGNSGAVSNVQVCSDPFPVSCPASFRPNSSVFSFSSRTDTTNSHSPTLPTCHLPLSKATRPADPVDVIVSAPRRSNAWGECHSESNHEDEKDISQEGVDHKESCMVPRCNRFASDNGGGHVSHGTSALTDTLSTGGDFLEGKTAPSDTGLSLGSERKEKFTIGRCDMNSTKEKASRAAFQWSTATASRPVQRNDSGTSSRARITESQLLRGWCRRDDRETLWKPEETGPEGAPGLLETGKRHWDGPWREHFYCAHACEDFFDSSADSGTQEIRMWGAVIGHLVSPPCCDLPDARPFSVFCRRSSVVPRTEFARYSSCLCREQGRWDPTESTFPETSEFPASPPSALLLPFLAPHLAENALPPQSPLRLFLSPCRFASLSRPSLKTMHKCLFSSLPRRSPTACCSYSVSCPRKTLSQCCGHKGSWTSFFQTDTGKPGYTGRPHPWLLLRSDCCDCFRDFIRPVKALTGEEAWEESSQGKRHSTQHSSVALLSESGLALPLASRWLQAVSHERKGLRDVLLSRARICDGGGGLSPRNSVSEHGEAHLKAQEATLDDSSETRDATEKRRTGYPSALQRPGKLSASPLCGPVSKHTSLLQRSSDLLLDWQRRELFLLSVYLGAGKMNRGGAAEVMPDSAQLGSRQGSCHQSRGESCLARFPSPPGSLSAVFGASSSLQRIASGDLSTSCRKKTAHEVEEETAPFRNWVHDWCTHIGFQDLQLRLFTYAIAHKGISNK
ncbi:hypothetical protein CSUI_000731 [Cystoisospora suis]|uniref:PH domain-containing protein n=1 Tax=Cystoisospora suis TaxID=483139 RepID=A0A2C6LCW6_9APIC|nr:hypothetical protein CSUI_000731 [Cystoisospora suis]